MTSTSTIPNSVTANGETRPVISIGEGAYRGVEVATNETWDLIIPPTVKEIEKQAFYKTPISSITSDAVISKIGVEAFAEMPKLTNVNLGTVTYIDDRAFNLDKSLTTVRLGTGVEYIGSKAFWNTYDDSKLTRFYLATETPPQIKEDTFPEGEDWWIMIDYKTYFYVPRQSVQNYRNANLWNKRRRYINSASELYDGTYYYTKDTINKEVTIVEYIGNSSSTLTIPDTFTIDNEEYKVVALKAKSFDSSNVKTIVLPKYLNYTRKF